MAVQRVGRGFTRVVPVFELTVGAFEVVPVKAALVDDAPVIAEFVDMQLDRLVAGLVRPSTPVQMQALTPNGQRTRLEVAVLLDDSFNRRAEITDQLPPIRRRSSYT